MAGLQIITADQRLSQARCVKGVIFGKSGIGKTSLLWTLPWDTTLFLDLEAGDLAIQSCPVDSLRPRTWDECRDLACFIGGPNPALRPNQPYSQAHFAHVCRQYGDPAALDKYAILFIDSIEGGRTAVLPVGARGSPRRSRRSRANPTCAAPTASTAAR